MNLSYHIPVLLQPSIEGLNIRPNGIYTDLTFGGGGHSRAILEKLENGRLIVFDQDNSAFENRIEDKRVEYVQHNFKYLYQFLKYLDAIPVDGILADLGVSSHHFDSPDRGFSFRFDSDLDMRMNRQQTLTAADILNSYSKEQLTNLFRLYGELPLAANLSSAIVKYRDSQSFSTTGELKDLASVLFRGRDINRFLGQVFQSLRIEVNDEIGTLKEMLSSSLQVLNQGGRLVVISYHSLEDRLVKNFMRTGDVSKSRVEPDIYGHSTVPFRVITRKVIVPDDNEVKVNSRARSAKLRIAEKI